MRAKTKKTKQTESVPLSLTLYPTVPSDAAKKVFLGKVGKPNGNGEVNSIVEIFLILMKRICETKRSFSIDSVFQEAKSFDLDNVELRRLFERWTQTMISLGKLEQINGVYDEPVFLMI